MLFSLDSVPHRYDHWGRYVQAALYAMTKRFKLEVGIQGLIHGTLPVGGLSSSAAVLLCYIMALADANELEVEPLELIQWAFEAEKEYIGLNLGKLDQSCEVLCRKDHLLFLDTRDETFELVAAPASTPEFDILIFFSGLTRTLMNTSYNTRTDECKVAAFNLLAYEGLPYGALADTRLRDVDRGVFDRWKHLLPAPLARRATHYMEESARVEEAVHGSGSAGISREHSADGGTAVFGVVSRADRAVFGACLPYGRRGPTGEIDARMAGSISLYAICNVLNTMVYFFLEGY